MKVLIADKLEKSALDGLATLGCEVVSDPDLKDQALHDKLVETNAEILVVRSTKVPREVLDGTNLSLIVRAGAGYNTIDVEAASEHGIYVSNCPGKNAIAVAELAFGLILSLDRMIPENVAALKQGVWNKKGFSNGRGLYGRTLGLVGLGSIGQAMIPRAQAFGMNVVVFSRYLSSEAAVGLHIGRAQSLEDLAIQSDVVSIHVSLTPETKNLIDKKFFNSMRKGALFVNTSRAEVVVQSDLLDCARTGKIRAGLDVFEGEPSVAEGSYDGSLTSAENVYCTHHIGAGTEQAQEAVAEETVRIVREFVFTGTVPNVVNISQSATSTHLLVVRHLDRVGVLAHVLEALKEDAVSVQEMENVILGRAKAAIAHISLDKAPSESVISKIRNHSDIFDASIAPIER